MDAEGPDAASDRLLESGVQIALLEPATAEAAPQASGAMMRGLDALEAEYR